MKSGLRDNLAVSYGMISILLIGSLRSPPPIRLRRTSPCSGGRINRSMLSCRDMAPWLAPPKGDCISSPVRAVVWFFLLPQGSIYTGAHKGAHHNPRARGASNFSPLRTFGPKGRHPSSPSGLDHKPPVHYFTNSPICRLIISAILFLASTSPWRPSRARYSGIRLS